MSDDGWWDEYSYTRALIVTEPDPRTRHCDRRTGTGEKLERIVDDSARSDVTNPVMSMQHTAHPLDVDLVDFVDGSLDPATTRTIAAHLEACLTCRVKRQRIAQTPPIPLVALDGVDVPNFDGIDIEHADPETAERGDLWLTANDDAVMVLVTKLRPHGRGVVVVPVVFDIEVADSGTLILDNSASPLPVPLAIYDGLFTSLPRSALHGRVIPARPDVDLLELTEADPGVSRGTPLDGPGDPRHEVRQDLIDRLVAVDRWPSNSADEPQAADEVVPSMPELDDDAGPRRRSAHHAGSTRHDDG